MTSVTPLNTAIIGFGRIGAAYADDPVQARYFEYATHAQVLQKHPAFDWYTVVDPSEEARALAASDRWGCSACFDSVENLSRAAIRPIEVAVIATPPRERRELLSLLPDLKAVIVEKPLGSDRQEAEGFVNDCKARGIAVQVNLWRRGDPLFRRLAAGELLSRIGRPQMAFGVYGNGLHNSGIHLVDFIDMLLGRIVSVQALESPRQRANNPIPGDLDQGFSVTTERGVTVAYLPLDFDHYREVSLDIYGTEGRLEILAEALYNRVTPRTSHRAMTGEQEINPEKSELLGHGAGVAMYHLYDNIAAVLKGKGTLWSPAEQALHGERVLDAIHRSAEEGGRRLALD